MHAEALAWVESYSTPDQLLILDIGGRDINGSTHGLFPGATFTTLDIRPGPGVDIVADAGTWEPPGEWDMVISTETFEHTANWADIVRTAYKALKPGGLFVATMAGPGRPEHSAVDGANLQPGEHYGNVDPGELRGVLVFTGFPSPTVDYTTSPADTRCAARKP